MDFDLDDSQHVAWQTFLDNKNVAVFGRAGCGKSAFLRHCIRHAERVHGANRVSVLAWTTHAAGLIGGETLHKFLRVGIAELSKEVILTMVRRNIHVRDRVKNTKVLIIDELPQISTRWLGILEYVVRQLAVLHKQALPWGGCQILGKLACPVLRVFFVCRMLVRLGVLFLVLHARKPSSAQPTYERTPLFLRTAAVCPLLTVGGDALQLGPVRASKLDPPVFFSRTFKDSFQSRWGVLVFLTGSHRQSQDAWFSACLDRVRVGAATDSDVRVLNATSAGVSDQLWGTRTQLCALNRQAAAYNAKKMQQLGGADTVYKCIDHVNERVTHPARRAYAFRRLQDLAPPSLTLKPGAVVLTTRVVDGIPTATQGVVSRCLSTHVVCIFQAREIVVSFVAFDLIDNRQERLASRLAIPLILSWAITIHRAQGATLDTLAVDFSDLRWREEGLVYSALSRCRSLGCLFVRGLTKELIMVSDEGVEFHRSLVPCESLAYVLESVPSSFFRNVLLM